jgi:glycosyltransferase involved in cell wall biosynthesis
MDRQPLVSIIVRTKDRPGLLKRALQSIAAQTYRPIEVVLVNDGGCDLDVEELKTILGDVSLNYIRLEKNTGRAHAGNVGIENAKGEYIGFLDDDDEFYQEHVETLVGYMLMNNSSVAYTSVEFKENGQKKWIFGKKFSFNELLIANYIPLIALLFKADFIKSFRFDESFELYEDWDMLIRVGEVSDFLFVNKITAIYNQWGNSQIAFNKPQEYIRESTLKLYKKHINRISPEIIFDMREECYQKDKIIFELEAKIRQIEEIKDRLEKESGEREAYLRTIQSGRGWKLLTRYYKLRDFILNLGRYEL